MKLKVLFGLLVSFLALTMSGCGGGGGDGGGGTTVSGVVAKGLVSGATVKVFEIISSHNSAKARVGTTALGLPAITAADGSFSVNIGGTVKKGGLLIQATGGTYTDEATGTINTALSSPINAAFGNISGIVRRGDNVVVSVTPFTEMGFQAIDVAANKPSDANIAAANGKVASTLGLTDVNILTTKPFAANATPPAGATAAQTTYSQALATVSQLMKDGSKTLAQVEAQFVPDIKAGALTQVNSDAGAVARLNFLNSVFNKTGAAQNLTVTVAASKTTVVNNNVDKAVISATVMQNSANVPDGTTVNFFIKSGAGANLTAATGTTVAGVASVDLKGTIDGAAVIVTAIAGGVATDSAAVNFVDPNKPGAITLTATPTTGVTTVVSAVPVTLTATVTPVSPSGVIAVGTPVTFTITSGTGGTLSAITTTAAGGVATAVLNSTQPGTITVTAAAGTVTSTAASVPFINQPTLATVTVALVGTLPTGTLIGGVTAKIAFSATKGLGTPVSTKLAIGNTSDLFAANTGVNPIITGAAWSVGTQPGDLQTLAFPIAAGNFPTSADFTVDPTSSVINLSNGSLAGVVSVTIKSVQIQ